MKALILSALTFAALSAHAAPKKYDLHCRGYAEDGLGGKRQITLYVYSGLNEMRVFAHNRISGAQDAVLSNAPYTEAEEAKKLRFIGKEPGHRVGKVEVVVHLDEPVRMSDRQVDNSKGYRTNIFLNTQKVAAVCAVGLGER